MAKIETTLTADQAKIAEALFALVPVVTVGKRSGNTISTEVPMAKMPEAAWTKIVLYGAQRVFNDAIGGSDLDQDAKVKKVRAMIADFEKGIVGRQASEGVDPVTAGIRAVMRGKLKANLPKEKWEKFEALEAKDQNAKLDEAFGKQSDAFRNKVTETVEAKLRAKAEEKAALSAIKVDFDL